MSFSLGGEPNRCEGKEGEVIKIKKKKRKEQPKDGQGEDFCSVYPAVCSLTLLSLSERLRLKKNEGEWTWKVEFRKEELPGSR